MKRLIVVIAPLLLLAVAQPCFAQNELARNQLVADRFRAWYNAEQYDSLYTLLGPEMKAAFDPDKWSGLLTDQVMPTIGTIGAFEPMSANSTSAFIANSEKKAVAMSLSVGKDGLVNGFHLAQPTHKQAQTGKPVRPQTPAPPYSYHSDSVVYENKDKSVRYGATFTYPNTGGPFATVLLITGSGTQDRDETLFDHKPFAVLADYLTKKGYAVLRVDDRGAGQTTGVRADLTSADFEKDVEAGLNYLKTRQEVNMKKLGLLGHSEGGAIAPMVAARRKDVSFIILWAGPVEGGAAINTAQNAWSLERAGMPATAVTAFKQLHMQELSLFKQYKDTTGLRTAVLSVFDKWKQAQPDSVLKPLMVSGNRVLGKDCYAMYYSLYSIPWMRFFITYDFAADLAKVKAKVLAINGDKDMQVSAAANLPLIKSILEQHGNKNVTTVVLPGLNHLLQPANTGEVAEYQEITTTIAPAALAVIGEWMDKEVGK